MVPRSENPKYFKRTRFILDRKWQLSVSSGVVGVALAGAGLYSIANYALAVSDPLNSLTGRQLGLLALSINAGYFLSLLAALTYMTVRYTHAVAGPAMVIERAVEGMIEGRFEGRLKLREKDYLKSLAATVNRLRDQMQQRGIGQEQVCAQLEEALGRADHAGALELVQQLRGAHPRADDTAKDAEAVSGGAAA